METEGIEEKVINCKKIEYMVIWEIEFNISVTYPRRQNQVCKEM